MVNPGMAQLVQVVCSVAATKTLKHIQLVALSGQSRENVEFAHHLSRSCCCETNFLFPITFAYNASSPPYTESGATHCDLWTSDSLFVAILKTPDDAKLVNIYLKTPTTKLSWIFFVDSQVFPAMMYQFQEAIDNKVIFIKVNGSGLSAWDAYRASAAVPAVYQYLTAVSVPPLRQQLDVLRREPWSRRTNLTGLVVRCSVLDYEPYSVLEERADGTVAITGLVGDILVILEGALRVKFECRKPRDNKWGSTMTLGGDWEGVLGDVYHNRADLALPFFYPNVDRAKAFDISYPFGEDWFVLVMRRPGALDGSGNYTRELSTTTWLAVAILFGVSVVTLNILQKLTASSPEHSWGKNLFVNFRAFCNMGWDYVEPQLASFRTWVLTLLLTVMVLHVSYTSSLLTMLTSNTIVLPFTDLQGLYKARNDYTLGFEPESILFGLFSRANSGIYKDIQDNMVSRHPEFLEEISAGLKRVANNPKHVFLMPILLVPKKDCALFPLPSKEYVVQTSILIQKDSPVTPYINNMLKKMHEQGLLQRFLRKWALQEASTMKYCSDLPTEPLGLEQTYTAFLMLLMGAATSVVLLFLEIICRKFLQYLPLAFSTTLPH
ncbi:glutamate receptor 3-like [Hyalella azteca]|uniref:Glutamate receptor 3-like n=1 Tax=Hyalella azteca TaxID=294128 RepID=A0A979FLB7_HYAAZ|nr:glutamate receptor 3-like [Hyalella azteca]